MEAGEKRKKGTVVIVLEIFLVLLIILAILLIMSCMA